MSRNDNHPRFWWTALSVTILVLARLPDLRADPDLWWHVKTGLEILSAGSIPSQDTFSYTAQGAAWINHEWLADVAFAAMYRFAGGVGLTVGRMLLLVSLCIVLLRLLWTRFPHPLLTLMMVALVLPYANVFINVRPHTFTYLLALVFILLFDLYRRGRWYTLVAVPVLMAIWANLHGGFLLGLGIAGLNLSWLLWTSRSAKVPNLWSARPFLVGIGLATLLATLVTPYGLELFAYLTRELGANHSTITEWQHPDRAQLAFALSWILGPPLFWLFARRVGNLVTAMLFLASVIVAYQHARFVILLVLFSAVSMFEALSSIRERLARRGEPLALLDRLAEPMPTVALVAALTMISSFGFIREIGRKGLQLEAPGDLCPVKAVDFLKHTSLGPKLALAYKWGGYAIWHLSPDYKVSVDGRNLTIYNAGYVDEYLRAYGDGEFSRVLKSYPPDVVLIESQGSTYRSMGKSEEWKEVFRDSVAAVFIPRGRVDRPDFPANVVSFGADARSVCFFP